LLRTFFNLIIPNFYHFKCKHSIRTFWSHIPQPCICNFTIYPYLHSFHTAALLYRNMLSIIHKIVSVLCSTQYTHLSFSLFHCIAMASCSTTYAKIKMSAAHCFIRNSHHFGFFFWDFLIFNGSKIIANSCKSAVLCMICL
jgi:hypothetical protein